MNTCWHTFGSYPRRDKGAIKAWANIKAVNIWECTTRVLGSGCGSFDGVAKKVTTIPSITAIPIQAKSLA